MKTIKLTIPDSTHDLAIQYANAEGIDPAHYCSTFITEHLGRTSIKRSTQKATSSNFGLGELASSGRKLPDTIEQIFSVCRYVWKNKIEYSEAAHRVSKDLCIQETTVRDKCTRRISLPNSPVNTDRFIGMLAQPNLLLEHLRRKFPRFSTEINQLFESILPKIN